MEVPTVLVVDFHDSPELCFIEEFARAFQLALVKKRAPIRFDALVGES
jgi:hypothetical protein